MEGLAITPDGNKFYGLMQSPLIQDGGRDGLNARILEVDRKTNTTREFVYQLDDKKHGTNEILAINDHQFLVIERDSKGGEKAKSKKIFKIDLNEASDVSTVAALPKMGLPASVHAVKKELFVDILDPKFKLAGADLPAKIEGLAFGPDLPDGRHLLLVTSDNDLIPTAPTWIYAFAIDSKDLPAWKAQKIEHR